MFKRKILFEINLYVLIEITCNIKVHLDPLTNYWASQYFFLALALGLSGPKGLLSLHASVRQSILPITEPPSKMRRLSQLYMDFDVLWLKWNKNTTMRRAPRLIFSEICFFLLNWALYLFILLVLLFRAISPGICSVPARDMFGHVAASYWLF